MTDSTHDQSSEATPITDQQGVMGCADHLIRNLSTKFARLEGPKVEKGIIDALGMLGEFVRAECSFLCFLEKGKTKIAHAYEWCKPGIPPKHAPWEGKSPDSLPWQSNIFRKLKNHPVPNDINLGKGFHPGESGNPGRDWIPQSPSLLLPIHYEKSSTAFLGFEGLQERETWPEGILSVLQTGGEILVNAWLRKKPETDFQETAQRFRSLVENSQEVIFSLDAQGRFTYLSPAAERFFRCPVEEMIGQPMACYVHPEDLGKFWKGLEHDFAQDAGSFEFRLVDREGNARYMRISGRPLFIEGKSAGLTGTMSDITIFKLAEVLLQRSERRYRSLFENAVEGIFQCSLEGQFLIANPACARILGFPSPDELIHPDSGTKNLCFIDPDKYQEFQRALKENGVVETLEAQLWRKDRRKIWVSLNVLVNHGSEGMPPFIEGRMEDITERKSSEDRIHYLSFHDKLTGLYNRAYFEEELKRLDTPRQLPISVILGDVNGLKLINDAFGHEEGDRLLRQIALILKESCRKEDIVARMGGDEFAVFLTKTGAEAAGEIIRRIRHCCSQKSIGPMQLSIALGSVTKDNSSQDMGKILRDAEEKMYQTKLLESKAIRTSLYSSLRRILFERSLETEEHTERLKELALRMGSSVGLPSSELLKLSLLAAWHDIGLVALPEEILKKTGPLTEEEWGGIRKHPEIGYRLAESSPELVAIAEAILYHHENWDGSGYPLGLKGEKIPLASRILTIVDAYEVMTLGRPFRKTLNLQAALEEIRKKAGSQFDPALVNIFSKIIGSFPPG
ncbi:MAG: diguanylate cyclase [Deltaproteobacteria bacterium]|nr:diguanylate cyclase [Deltaproteobacteria bacterium]